MPYMYAQKGTDEYESQSWLDWNMDLKRSKRAACWTSSNKRAREETEEGRESPRGTSFILHEIFLEEPVRNIVLIAGQHLNRDTTMEGWR